MKNIITKTNVFSFFLIFSIFSCSEKNSVTSSMTSPELGGASHTEVYTDTNELKEISKTKNALNWKMARFLAYEELLSVETENGWAGASLSATPIVIYSSTSKPKYYEFRVIKNNKEEIGAITANIYPKGGVIAYTLKFVRNYTKAMTKGVNGKVIDNAYPSVAFGVIGKSGDKVSALINTKGERMESREPADIIEMADFYGMDKLAEQTGLSKEELGALIQERRNTLTELESDFRLMNEALPNVENLTDEEIKDMLAPRSKSIVTINRKIPAYQNIEKYFFYRGSYDASDLALAWVYYGIYKDYKNISFSFPNRDGERMYSDKDNTGLIKDLAIALETGGGVTFPWYLGKGLSAVTSGQYTVGEALDTRTTFTYMKRANLPVISLRTGRWDNGKKDSFYHYRVIYGIRESGSKNKPLWRSWSDSHDQRMYMHDNGLDTPDGATFFMESVNNQDVAHFRVKRR